MDSKSLLTIKRGSNPFDTNRGVHKIRLRQILIFSEGLFEVVGLALVAKTSSSYATPAIAKVCDLACVIWRAAMFTRTPESVLASMLIRACSSAG